MSIRRRRIGAAVLPAVVMAGCESAVEPDDVGVLSTPDVHVAWISREPRISAPSPTDPPDAGWPNPGQEVMWVGHIYNAGAAAEDAGYVWSVDDAPVLEGRVDVPPGETIVSLRRPWPVGRERITLAVDPLVGGSSGSELTVESDALAVALWMDRTLADHMQRSVELEPFPVWAGLHVQRWNDLLTSYSSVEGPAEILDRIRLDDVRITPDALPWPSELHSDFWWWYRSGRGTLLKIGSSREQFANQAVVLHELLHQRGIADLYAYWVWEGESGSDSDGAVLIREPTGELAVGGERMPYVREWSGGKDVFESPYLTYLMGTGYDRRIPVISPHTAFGLNTLAGRRTPQMIDRWGNFNTPFGGHEYLSHVPDSVRVSVETTRGPAPEGSKVEVFFDHGIHPRGNRFEAEPDQVTRVGSGGIATLDVRPFRDPVPGSTERFDTDVVILRVTVDGEWGYAFLPVYELNMEYIRGRRDVGEVDISLKVR